MKNKKLQLSKILGMLLLLTMVVALSIAIASAQTYPTKPVRFVVANTPGASVDLVARMIATKLGERLGKQVIVENRPGGGGIIGVEMVSKAAPDGYTLLFAGSIFTTQPALQKLPYDPIKSFVPVAKMATSPFILVIHPSVPAKSVKELIALAKQKPGKLTFGDAGMGSGTHMVTELFKIQADIDFMIVHYKGGGPLHTDLLGGHINAAMLSITGPLPLIKSGKLAVLATGGKKRNIFLPDVPTFEEGGITGFEANQWWGISAPAGTPVPIVDRLNNELKAILATDEVKKWFLNDGSETDYLGPPEFGQFVEKEIAQWTRVVKEANIKLEK